ncbi:MAG: FAD:protein FMN transferase [bacterium]
MTKETRLIMGMPITICIVDKEISNKIVDEVFDYFIHIDETFSPYKESSEVSKINRKEISEKDYSEEMKEVLNLSELTKQESHGYFDVFYNNKFNPSGLVKGWAIWKASKILDKHNVKNYFIDAGGDIQTKGFNDEGKKWSVGIKDPWKQENIVKTVYLSGEGIATSGTYIRGEHIYDPINKKNCTEIASISIIAKNIYEADRMATSAFVMGEQGIYFIENLPGFEGFQINNDKIGIMTTDFENFT